MISSGPRPAAASTPCAGALQSLADRCHQLLEQELPAATTAGLLAPLVRDYATCARQSRVPPARVLADMRQAIAPLLARDPDEGTEVVRQGIDAYYLPGPSTPAR
jgi:hypothetical protein